MHIGKMLSLEIIIVLLIIKTECKSSYILVKLPKRDHNSKEECKSVKRIKKLSLKKIISAFFSE